MANWQTGVETGRVVAIAKAAENLAAPTTLPATGSNLDWTETASGENAEGWAVSDWKFAEDDIVIADADGEPIIVKPPTAGKRVALIYDTIMNAETIDFTSYEAGTKLLTWATNVTDASNVYTRTATFTRVALCIEIGGLGLHYFPSVEIAVASMLQGVKTLATHGVHIEVFPGSSVTSGHNFEMYQDA